jgi:hypothetical protein
MVVPALRLALLEVALLLKMALLLRVVLRRLPSARCYAWWLPMTAPKASL